MLESERERERDDYREAESLTERDTERGEEGVGVRNLKF